jgi:hypothetical protein
VISVLVPSRERPGPLARSVESLGGGRDLEVLVRVDEDDPCLDDYLRVPGIEPIVGPHHGYGALQRYYNELAERATRDWLFIWNDDCIMRTPGWIDVVRRYDGKLAVLNPDTNHDNWAIDMNVFPIFPRRMVELIGHLSLSAHNDSWIEFLGRGAGIMARVPIVIVHDRADLTGNNDDATYAHREIAREEFHSPEMAALRERDIRLILDYLERNPEARPDVGAAT